MERIRWIDLLRGICILAILLDHTELYATGRNIIPYSLYIVNALTLFFFISGYLFYSQNGFNWRRKLRSITLRLILPYFFFTAIMALPKMWAHANNTSINHLLTDILTGNASWFVAALIVSELIFMLILCVSQGKTQWIILLSIIAFLASIPLSTHHQPLFWQLDNAFQALLFLCAGYVYHQNESRFNHFHKSSYTYLLIILLLIIKILEYKWNVALLIWPIHITNYALFLIDIFTTITLTMMLIQRLPTNRLIEWTGAHSLVYYFLCGGVPLLLSRFTKYIGIEYDTHYLFVVLLFAAVYITSSALTWMIYQLFNFLKQCRR